MHATCSLLPAVNPCMLVGILCGASVPDEILKQHEVLLQSPMGAMLTPMIMQVGYWLLPVEATCMVSCMFGLGFTAAHRCPWSAVVDVFVAYHLRGMCCGKISTQRQVVGMGLSWLILGPCPWGHKRSAQPHSTTSWVSRLMHVMFRSCFVSVLVAAALIHERRLPNDLFCVCCPLTCWPSMQMESQLGAATAEGFDGDTGAPAGAGLGTGAGATQQASAATTASASQPAQPPQQNPGHNGPSLPPRK